MADLPEIEPHRDPQTEQLLDRRQIGWQLQWIRVDDIDWRTTTDRQVRSDGIDPDRLQRYRESLDTGATFPAVLAWDRGAQGGWVLLGGIHRAQAHEAAGREWLPAYTVAGHLDPYLLALEHNATHGDALSTADKVRHAEQLVTRHGLSRTAAARTVGISVHALDRARAIAAGTRQASTLGVSGSWAKLKDSAKARIQWSCQDHATFVEAVRTAVGCSLTTPQVADMAAHISAAGGAGPDAIQAIEDFEIEHHPARSGQASAGGPAPAAARARRAALNALDAAVAEVAESCHPSDRALTSDLLFRAAKHLAAAAAAVKETTP
jgi:hypothetical protein